MKNLLVLVLLSLGNIAYSQNLKKTQVKEVSNKSVIEILTHFESHTVFNGKRLMINIFKISNGAGSAQVAGDDETAETYFVTVTDSSGDERPIFKVYSVGPFYGSKIISNKDLGDTYSITLQDHNSGHPTIHHLKIDLKNIIYN